MSKIGYKLINLLLFIAFVLFFAVFFITIFMGDKQHARVLNALPVFLIIAGITVAILTVNTKSAYQLFIGGMLTFAGLLSFLFLTNLIPGSIKQWWPVYGVAGGILLFVSGFYKYKKIDWGFVIPSIVLEILGFWLMLFSFKIVSISFKTFMICFGPLLLVMFCVLLFVIYILQKKNSSSSSAETEINQFEDDELIPE
ncbi:MAG: hypothetical protein MJ179_03510 [Treponema sp.]|nr:hypothetical protein [Treponema sp.]